MKKLSNALLGAALLVPVAATAQQFDMAAIQKWDKVTAVRYKVVGEFSGWAQVAGGLEGSAAQGEVKDSFELEFDYDAKKEKVLGTVAIRNGKTTVGKLRDTGQCATPQLKGDVEFFEVKEAKLDGARMQLVGTRSYPDAMTAQQCPASRKLMPAKATTVKGDLWVAIPDPKMMGMAGMPLGNAKMGWSADKKSFVMKPGDGWTLTYTPTPK